MTIEMATRALDVDLLARELGNWRTSSRSGPAYKGLADGIRMLIIDGRLPVGARLPSERALAEVLRVSRTTVTAAYTQLGDDGYLNARRGARSTTALTIIAMRTGSEVGVGISHSPASTVTAMTMTLAIVPMPGRFLSGIHASSTATPTTADAIPIVMPV